MKLGIFGGTFNPVHLGHLRAAEEVREQAGLDKVVFVPSHLPPHKELAGDVPGRHRLELVKIAVRDNPHFLASDVEVNGGGVSYSVHTIEHFRGEFDTVPWFILGQDAFDEIAAWYDMPRILTLANFLVMSRPGSERGDVPRILGPHAVPYTRTATGYVHECGTEIRFVDVTMLDISSSAIRERIAAGASIRYLVTPGVEEYIMQERMYR